MPAFGSSLMLPSALLPPPPLASSPFDDMMPACDDDDGDGLMAHGVADGKRVAVVLQECCCNQRVVGKKTSSANDARSTTDIGIRRQLVHQQEPGSDGAPRDSERQHRARVKSTLAT